MFFQAFVAVLVANLFSIFLKKPAKHSSSSDAQSSSKFSSFQANYLLVYFLAVAADWLQGPYVYALYSHYGYENNDIARLYIAGFASSAVFGTFVASVADKYGRRSNALLYCLTYILSCVTKHSSSFHFLLLGRILGGIAYSILFSAFESWMVYEHHNRAYDNPSLAITFSRAQFGNAVVAILAGQVAGWFADRFGKVMPFDISILVLAVLAVIIATTWTENYGDSEASLPGGFRKAIAFLIADQKILLLGVSQAAFEGALYTFTFIWTPALQTAPGQAREIPHGTIFSSFMAATMIGTNLFAYWQRFYKVELLMRNVFVVGVLLFSAAAVFQRVEVVYAAFLAYEVLCGIYFPGMATMRAPYIPEESRSALLTFFRVPLNIIVVVALYEDMNIKSVFILCACLMMVAVLSQQRLLQLTTSVTEPTKTTKDTEEVEPNIC